MANPTPPTDNTRLTAADLRSRLRSAPGTETAAPVAEDPNIVNRRARLSTADLILPATFSDMAIPTPQEVTAPPAPARPAPPTMRRTTGLSSAPGLSSHSGSRGGSLYAPPSTLPVPPDPFARKPADYHDPASALFGQHHQAAAHDIDALRAENSQLQTLLEEMRQIVQEASDHEQKLQNEIETIHKEFEEAQKMIAELQNQIENAPPPPKTSDELTEWADELERESARVAQDRRKLDKERQQIREDEEALEKQMREMEVQMARERAMLARQETELRRLNTEIQHELEAMQRGDAALRDRLTVFQRRHSEVMSGPPQAGMSHSGSTILPPLPPPAATPAPPPTQKKNDTTGLLRKIFRNGSE